jgi:sigma-B regulation protein RsbU (phosphoserine phosphatase)
MVELEIGYGGKNHPLRLEDGEHTVGRSGDSAVKIPVARVSKSHAILRVCDGRLYVRDLGSTNGTELNGTRVGADEVEVGPGSLLSFAGTLLRWAMDLPISQTFVRPNQVTTRLRYNMSEGYSAAARDRIVDMSSGMFELLSSGSDAETVGQAACRFVANWVQADRVVLLEDRGEATSVEICSRWTKEENSDAPLQLSSTIVGRVLSQRESILAANPLEDPNLIDQHSILSLNLRSAMAAPLFDNERVRGILYVDTANPEIQYGQADLEVLTATANAVAVKLRNISFEKEMRTAANIQRAMLPSTIEPPAGYELEPYQVMCRAVGGDLYQCLPRRVNGKYLFALGDVSGKGMTAALAMGAATVLIGMLAEIDGDLLELTGHLHRQLFRSLTPEQFVTMFLAELDAETGAIRYVNAGHEPPLIIRADGSLDRLEPTGLPVGMIEDFMLEAGEAHIGPGDLLAIFSDGVPEATTDGDRFLGMDPVQDILMTHSREPLSEIRSRIVSAVDSYLAGEPNSDDVTLLLLRRKQDG